MYPAGVRVRTGTGLLDRTGCGPSAFFFCCAPTSVRSARLEWRQETPGSSSSSSGGSGSRRTRRRRTAEPEPHFHASSSPGTCCPACLSGLEQCLRTPGADRCGAPHGFYFFPYSSTPHELKVRRDTDQHQPGPLEPVCARQGLFWRPAGL